jgi:hypothetical protein
MTARTTLGKFCITCQAIPQAGYCNLAGCPSRPPTDCPSPPQADRVEAAQVLYEKVTYAWKGASSWDLLSDNLKADWRAGVAALRPVTSVAPEGMREGVAKAIAAFKQFYNDHSIFLNTGLDGHLEDAMRLAILAALPLASGSDHGPVGWRRIAEHDSHFPVLVSREPDKYIYPPKAAFVDVTGVWRIYGSEGGMSELGFTPTVFQPLPSHYDGSPLPPPPTGDK